jgi:TatD DNase family protein
MVHCLRAWGWLMDVLNKEPVPEAGFLIHACGCSPEMLAPLAAKGAYFSYGGGVLHPRKIHQRESLVLVPPDRLLIETDAPDILPPASHRPFSLFDAQGKEHNVPANLRAILSGIAELRHESEENMAAQLHQNFLRFFGQLV